MAFNTTIFFLFFAGFFLLYSFVFLQRFSRTCLILIASLIFYASWNYHFIPLLIFSGLVDFGVGTALNRETNQKKRKLLVAISIATNLGILAIFKYADFAMQSVMDMFAVFGYTHEWRVMEFVLPIGISFYTFQGMSYTIDVYRGELRARKSLLTFLAALFFFPHLMAGPILRAKHILPQLEKLPYPTWSGVKHGFLLFSIGLFKKTLADLLAGLVDKTFADGGTSVLESWTGALAFAAQIYGDFSGYTDMAIGLGLILGINFPPNFRLPYFAVSPVDFWRRWHISLSSWLRDYLYISLGGNRHHRYRNILITMLLGGLWHGAAWTFVVWGIFHGVLIVATHFLAGLPIMQRFSANFVVVVRVSGWAVTFYLVLVGWVVFRAANLNEAFELLSTMHFVGTFAEASQDAMLYFTLTLVTLLLMHLLDWLFLSKGTAIESRRHLFWPLLFILQVFCYVIGAPSDGFIYFQF